VCCVVLLYRCCAHRSSSERKKGSIGFNCTMSNTTTTTETTTIDIPVTDNNNGAELSLSPQTAQRRGAFIGRDRGDKRLSMAAPIGGYRNASKGNWCCLLLDDVFTLNLLQDSVPLLSLPVSTAASSPSSPRSEHSTPPLLKSPRTLELMSLVGSTTPPSSPAVAPSSPISAKNDFRRSVAVGSGPGSRTAGMGALASGS